jgi:tetratricopeptide (TPR) repeat protein
MVLTDTPPAPTRHPWLEALIAAPAEELHALLAGYAAVAPYGKAEPADAALPLLYGLDANDPARAAFDRACLDCLGLFRTRLAHAGGEDYAYEALLLDRLLAVIRRIRPERTVADLHGRYVYWFSMVETATIDDGLDCRREFWRVLALTQDMVDGARDQRRLMPLWLELCAEAGPQGGYHSSYLDVGLLGLRRLPLGPSDASTEEAVCHGIARWAARQQPGKSTFLNRWREIESAYPRSPDYWPDLVADVIAATEAYLGQLSNRPSLSFPAAAWWRQELEPPPLAPGQTATPSGRRRQIEPEPQHRWAAIINDIHRPMRELISRIDQQMRAQRRYADATGDTYYVVRTACNIGKQLLRPRDEAAARGAAAVGLARLALSYAPHSVFAWALWRDALAAQGLIHDAELVGWEALRRYPENPHWRTQLATLLEYHSGRLDEAERLLADTIALFPLDGVARVHRARILSDRFGRHDDADHALRQTIKTVPDNVFAYNELASLRVRHFQDPAGARDILLQAQQRGIANEATRNILSALNSGHGLRPRRADPVIPPPEPDRSSLDFDAAPARLRRALFHAEHMDDARRDAAIAAIRQAGVDDPAMAYARYAATRVGVGKPGGHPDTALAFAFEQARQARDVAAFIALRRIARGLDLHLLNLAIVLAAADASLPVAPASVTHEPDAIAIRVGSVIAVVRDARRHQPDVAPLLLLLSDFGASRLSATILPAA